MTARCIRPEDRIQEPLQQHQQRTLKPAAGRILSESRGEMGIAGRIRHVDSTPETLRVYRSTSNAPAAAPHRDELIRETLDLAVSGAR